MDRRPGCQVRAGCRDRRSANVHPAHRNRTDRPWVCSDMRVKMGSGVPGRGRNCPSPVGNRFSIWIAGTIQIFVTTLCLVPPAQGTLSATG